MRVLRESEAALRESEERYRHLLDSTHDLVQSVDRQGRFSFVNRAWLDALGYAEHEVADLTLWDVIHPDSIEHCKGVFAQLMQGERDVPILSTFVTKHGAPVHLEGLATGRRLGGQLIGTHVFLKDVTEQRHVEEERARLHEQLIQSQKMEALGQLAAGIAHDFNNSLTVVGGNLDLVLVDPRVPKEVREELQMALDAVGSAAMLAQRLLAFSRRQTLHPEPADLNEMVRGMLGLLRRTLGKTIEVVPSLAGDLDECFVDRGQFQNAILNLAINARDAMPDGGRLTIATRNVELGPGGVAGGAELPPGDHVRLTVSDTGCGMAPDVLARATEPFFTTKPTGEGTGLGLSMVYGLVQQSEGHLGIASEVGIGTTITLDLPRWEEHASGALHGPAMGKSAGGGERSRVRPSAVRVRRDVLARRGPGGRKRH